MDVTRLSGALRAADAPVSAVRESGPAFESFLPRDTERAQSRRDADRLTRAEQAEARHGERVEKRQAEARRIERREAEERRLDARREARAEERRAEERRAEERRAEERRAEERRAEERRAEERRAERERAEDADALQIGPSIEDDLALLVADTPVARIQPPVMAVQPPEGLAEGRVGADTGPLGRTPGPAEFAGPAGDAGVRGLVEWLQSRPGQSRSGQGDGPRAQRAMDLMAGQGADPARADAEPPIAMADGVDEADGARLLDGLDGLDAESEAEGDPARELTRLLEGRKPSFEGGREGRGGDSVRLGPQPQTPGVPGIGGPSLSPTVRIADVSAAARTGTTPTALPEGVDESSIMRQISDALRLRNGRAGRAQTAEIALHPAELGRVRIKIRMEGGSARVLVSAEHAAVGDLLAAGLEQLRRDLMAQGVHVAHLEVRSGLADEGGGRGETPEQDEAEELDAAPEAKPGATPEPGARRPRSRIDVEA